MVTVIKADGTSEEFSKDKLLASIKRAGIPDTMRQEVLQHVLEKLHDTIATSEIYQHIIEFLDKAPSPSIKARYSLKQSIMELGPTGYPFEDYIAKLLEKRGYKMQTRVIVPGTCVKHEIDGIAEKDSEKIMIEAKFHNKAGIPTDVHVSLYTKARFDDVKEKHGFSKALLVTNTKATTDAIAYAQCVGMDILSWSYPQDNSLRDIVEKESLYPVTALATLSDGQKQQLLQNGIVLCQQIVSQPQSLLFLPEDKRDQVIREAKSLCLPFE